MMQKEKVSDINIINSSLEVLQSLVTQFVNSHNI